MTPDRFDDELLCAVLDGEADPATIAAVRADAAANARLRELEEVSRLVAIPPEPATPERRSASIAAALAAATSAPEVTSLAPARERRRSADRIRRPGVEWIAVAAAAILVLVAAPFLLRLGDDSTELAGDAPATTTARLSTDAADDAAVGDADVATDAAAESLEGVDDGVDAAPSGDEAADVDEPALDVASRITSVSNERLLRAFVEDGIVRPELLLTDPELLDVVAPECLERFGDETGEAFALLLLTPPDGPERLVLAHFGPDIITTLDASDCSPVG